MPATKDFVVDRVRFSSDLLTTNDAAKAVGLTPESLRVYRAKGIGPKFVKLGRSVRYRITDLQKWLDQRDIPA